jgi:hypothetical protein
LSTAAGCAKEVDGVDPDSTDLYVVLISLFAGLGLATRAGSRSVIFDQNFAVFTLAAAWSDLFAPLILAIVGAPVAVLSLGSRPAGAAVSSKESSNTNWSS